MQALRCWLLVSMQTTPFSAARRKAKCTLMYRNRSEKKTSTLIPSTSTGARDGLRAANLDRSEAWTKQCAQRRVGGREARSPRVPRATVALVHGEMRFLTQTLHHRRDTRVAPDTGRAASCDQKFHVFAAAVDEHADGLIRRGDQWVRQAPHADIGLKRRLRCGTSNLIYNGSTRTNSESICRHAEVRAHFSSYCLKQVNDLQGIGGFGQSVPSGSTQAGGDPASPTAGHAHAKMACWKARLSQVLHAALPRQGGVVLGIKVSAHWQQSPAWTPGRAGMRCRCQRFAMRSACP